MARVILADAVRDLIIVDPAPTSWASLDAAHAN
jgi:hypothetical protein